MDEVAFALEMESFSRCPGYGDRTREGDKNRKNKETSAFFDSWERASKADEKVMKRVKSNQNYLRKIENWCIKRN